MPTASRRSRAWDQRINNSPVELRSPVANELGHSFVLRESRAVGALRPSPRVKLLLMNVTRLVGTRAVAVRVRVAGTSAPLRLDDVYLDPWKSY